VTAAVIKPLLAPLVAVAFSLSLYTPATSLAVPERYQFIIAVTGWQPAEVPMLAAVVNCESSWNTFAVGQAGELGLMQIMPSTWEYINTPEPYGLGSDAPTSWESWWWPSAQFYQARQLYEAQGWRPWSCAYL
jgi:soluble lytic murein transglycosylase-like protein